MDTVKMQSLAQFQNWPFSIYILILAAVATLVAHHAWRPSFPKKAPKLVPGGWPILGMLRFFNDRRNFFNYGKGSTKTGNFSFYWGKLQIVGMSGFEGRKTFFESKDLNMAEGYAVLFAASPSVEGATGPGDSGGFTQWFSKTITRMMKKENFVKNLPVLVEDTQTAFGAVVARNGGMSGIMDPFDDLYRIVYQLTMRTVGATEIAESPAMLAKTLRLFEEIEKATSPARIVFPWLPTVNYFKRMITGARLYYTFSNIAQARKKSGKREDDALQYLLDTGEDMIKILAFVLGALFAGQLNSGINAAWMFAFLAKNPEWKAKVRAEVDSVVAKHRAHPGQKPFDVLKTLTIEEWEGEFPLIDMCLRECIRFTMVGTAFRKNLGGRDVPIGNSGEVVPKDAFSVYLIEDTHFDPSIYTDPYKWDPGRFLPERAEDKKQPLSYLGWGIGRHPCLGMRFAKLEMGIIGACFIAMFDYEVVDANGKPLAELPQIDRSKFSAHKPNAQIRLKYQVREGAI